MNHQPDITLVRIEGSYPRRMLTATQVFQDINGYLAWENQRVQNEPCEKRGASTMLYMNRRAKLKLVKAISPEYQVESLNFKDYTAQELTDIWQDDDLLDEILCELIEALPNDAI